MTIDDQLRRTTESLVNRVREETERQLASLTAELSDTIESQRAAAAAQAASEARRVAEQEAAEHLAAVIAAAEAREREAIASAVAAAAHERDAVAAAEMRQRAADAIAEARAAEAAREAGRAEGRALGLQEGLKEGRREGRVEGRIEGREEGREEGWLEGRRAGHELGLQEGRQREREEILQKGGQPDVVDGYEQAHREGVSEGLKKGMELGRSAELAANERLVEAIRSIDAARSLTEVLDALASSAGREAPRVAVLIVRSGQLRGWRFVGFDRMPAEHQDVDAPIHEAGVIAEAARRGMPVSADSAATLSMPSFAELPPGRELLAVPVQMSGQVIAVLYADQGATEEPSTVTWQASLELMARHAARSLEAITAYRAAQVLTERPDVRAVKDPAVESAAVTESAENENRAALRQD